jgi:hypothetical protein
MNAEFSRLFGENMGEIVNLRRVRKQVARQRVEALAAENRIVHGRSKAERELAQARAEKNSRTLEAHRLEREDGQ